MRRTPLKFALLLLLAPGAAAQAQVNLLKKPHHVYIKPKPADQPSGSATTAAPMTAAAPAPAAQAAPAPSAAAPATPQP